jgi:hypothetical protein
MTAPRTATGRARQAPPPLAPDPAAAGDFLDQWAGLTGVPHATLVRIIPDHPDPRTAAKGRAFRWPADRDEALRWIVANNEHSNLYFSVNTAKPVPKKPLKKDIEALNAVHADVDPQGGTDLGEERERLINLAAELAGRKRPPSFVLDSGGGIQAFFVAAESCPADPTEYIHEVETYNARLACVLGGDITTRNADRIMRVPGTVNWPDQRKRDRGRVPTMASLLHASGRTYHWREIADEITALEDEPPEHAAAPFEPRTRFGGHPGGNGAVLEGMPPYPTDDQLKALLENHPEVAAIWDQSTSWPPLDTSPNGWDYRFCSELSFIGFEPDLIGSFLRAYRAHHAPEKGKHDREDYIMRTVEAATARHREEPDEDDGPPFEAGPAGPNGPAGDGGQRQTAGDAKGRNRGTFHAGAKPGADWPEPGVLGEPPAAPEFPTWLLPRASCADGSRRRPRTWASRRPCSPSRCWCASRARSAEIWCCRSSSTIRAGPNARACGRRSSCRRATSSPARSRQPPSPCATPRGASGRAGKWTSWLGNSANSATAKARSSPTRMTRSRPSRSWW